MGHRLRNIGRVSFDLSRFTASIKRKTHQCERERGSKNDQILAYYFIVSKIHQREYCIYVMKFRPRPRCCVLVLRL